MRKYGLASIMFLAAMAFVAAASADERKYGPGVSDTEIKIGQTVPYSGPVSVYGQIGHAQQAYFAKINAEGGINGRKINLISLDDGYMPPKTLEQVRKLVEREKVLFDLQLRGYGHQYRRAPVSKPSESAAPLCRGRRYGLGRLPALPLDHRLGQQLSNGGQAIRRAHFGESAEREDRSSFAQ